MSRLSDGSNQYKRNEDKLTAGGLDTGGLDVLGSLHLGLSTGRTSVLNLFSALSSFHFLLLLLGFFSGSSAGSLLDSFGFGALGNDFFPSSTNNGTLNLDGLASTALGNFLGGTLLVETTVEDGPVELTGVLLSLEVGSTFTVQQTERLGITTDKDDTMAGINLGTREGTNFGPKGWVKERRVVRIYALKREKLISK